jgi:hypothetical protein
MGFRDSGKSRDIFVIAPGWLPRLIDDSALLFRSQALLMHGGIEPRQTRMQRLDVDMQVLDPLIDLLRASMIGPVFRFS